MTATFLQASPVLTATVSGGDGTVTSEPAGLRCAATGGTCQASFSPATTVLLRATPGPGRLFEGWGSNCDLRFEDTCRVDLTQDRSVTASFVSQGPALSLTVTGGGTVTSEPAGLLCGQNAAPTCQASFAADSSVTLTATPDPGGILSA